MSEKPEQNNQPSGRKHKILLVIRWPVSGIRTFLCHVYKDFDPSLYHFTIFLPELETEHQSLEAGLKNLNPTYIKLSSLSHIVFLKELIKTIRSEKYDLIHSHGSTAGVYTSLLARIWRTPHLLTLHERLYKEHFTGIIGAVKQKILSFLFSNPDVIHLVSDDSKDNLLEFLPNLKNEHNKLISILSGIEISKYWEADKRDLHAELNLPEDTFLIGFLGYFRQVKGFRYLVDALEYLLQHTDEIEKTPVVLTFGNTCYVREEMAAVRKRQLDKYVFSLPFTPNIASTLRGLDVVAMPSLSEACPLLPMEAMVAGVPVIGTSCPGLREVLKDTPSVMVPPADGVALGKALAKEINNPSWAKTVAFREEAAQRFDVKKPVMELEKIICELIGRKNQRSN